MNSADRGGTFSEYSSTKTFSKVPNEAPTIKQANVTENDITIAWDPPKNDFGVISGYNVFWRKTNDDETDTVCCHNCQVVKSPGEKKTSHTIAGLDPYSWYAIQLQIYNDNVKENA